MTAVEIEDNIIEDIEKNMRRDRSRKIIMIAGKITAVVLPIVAVVCILKKDNNIEETEES